MRSISDAAAAAAAAVAEAEAKVAAVTAAGTHSRGLHFSAFRLDASDFCGIGVHLGVVQGVFGGCLGASRWGLGCNSCQERLGLS